MAQLAIRFQCDLESRTAFWLCQSADSAVLSASKYWCSARFRSATYRQGELQGGRDQPFRPCLPDSRRRRGREYCELRTTPRWLSGNHRAAWTWPQLIGPRSSVTIHPLSSIVEDWPLRSEFH